MFKYLFKRLPTPKIMTKPKLSDAITLLKKIKQNIMGGNITRVQLLKEIERFIKRYKGEL